MEKFLFYKVSLTLVLIILMGCKNQAPRIQDSVPEVEPLWESKLPGGAGIYNDGLIGLPIYKNEIYFHSTYFTGKQGEDNRIHALNLETGNVIWTYPENYNKGNSLFFWGVPYLNDNCMVIKMPGFENVCTSDRITCLDLESHTSKWTIELPDSMSLTSGNNITGQNNKFYFCQESAKKSYVFEGNVLNGDTLLLFQFDNKNEIAGVEISTEMQLMEIENRQVLVFGLLEWTTHTSDLEFENYLMVADVESKKIIHKILIPKTEKYSINQIYCHNNKIWLTCGRNASCIDSQSGQIIWNYFSPESLNYLTTGICVDEDVLFLWGDNRFQALNASTGEKMYQNNLECGNASVFDGIVYIIGRDAKLYCVDILTGSLIRSVICPENNQSISTGFLTSCKPKVFKNSLFVFGNFHAYSYCLQDLIR